MEGFRSYLPTWRQGFVLLSPLLEIEYNVLTLYATNFDHEPSGLSSSLKREVEQLHRVV